MYSYWKMTDILVKRDSMNEDEAMEYIDYNVVRAFPYYGDKKPIVGMKKTEILHPHPVFPHSSIPKIFIMQFLRVKFMNLLDTFM